MSVVYSSQDILDCWMSQQLERIPEPICIEGLVPDTAPQDLPNGSICFEVDTKGPHLILTENILC